MKHRRHRALGMALVVSLSLSIPARVEAGPRKFVDAVASLLDQVNVSMSEAGSKFKEGIGVAVKDGFKREHFKKAISDFSTTITESEAAIAPKRAAVWESLKDLPMWIPQAIANTWKGFVRAIKAILGPLLPGGGDDGGRGEPEPDPAPPPPAPDPDPAPDPTPDPGDGGGDPPPGDGGGDPPPPADGGDEGGDQGGDPPPAGGEDSTPPADGDQGTPPPADGGDGGEGGDAPPPADEGGAPPPADEGGGEDPTPPPADEGGEEDPTPPAEEGEEPKASTSPAWFQAARAGFESADPSTRYQVFGQLGTLLQAEETKQARGRAKGSLDPKSSQVLSEKLESVRELYQWMSDELARSLSRGQGVQVLKAHMKVLGKSGSRVFGPMIREAKRIQNARKMGMELPE